MKFCLDPPVVKVVFIALLLFSEALLVNAYSVLQQGRFPSVLEIVTFLFGALIQLVTFLMTFVVSGEIPTVPDPTPTPGGSNP